MRMADWQLKAEWRVRLGVLQDAIKEGRRALDARAERRLRGAAEDGEAR
jgi:two-component system sensor histidine kinase RpfC